MVRIRFANVLVLIAATAVTAGCGSKKVPGRPATFPATVNVTYNGSPVDGASVVLHGKNPSDKPAMCTTDATGTGKLFTFEPGDGAIPGSYVATVEKMEQPPALTTEQYNEMMQKGEQPPEPKSVLPAKYKDKATSGLTATIAQGPNEVKLELKD